MKMFGFNYYLWVVGVGPFKNNSIILSSCLLAPHGAMSSCFQSHVRNGPMCLEFGLDKEAKITWGPQNCR